MRFLGGKRAPGTYIKGEIYLLTERHALFPWFERVDKKAKPEKVPAATPEESVFDKQVRLQKAGSFEPEKSEDDKFQEAFNVELTGAGDGVPIIPGEKKVVETPDAEALRKKYDRLTKKELITIIQEKGGVADEGMMKAMLVEIALSKGS